MVMLCVANVGRIRCLWAICSESGPICSESGSKLLFIWSQCGPSREMFVGLRDYVWGPLQLWRSHQRHWTYAQREWLCDAQPHCVARNRDSGPSDAIHLCRLGCFMGNP